jgi:hypothetical protein
MSIVPQPVRTSPAAATAHLPYTIPPDGQVFERTFRPDGTFGGLWTVTVIARNGTQFTIQIPEEQYTAKAVHSLAMANIHEIDAVARLPENA